MLCPYVPAWVEERDERRGLYVYARQIRTLTRVTSVAGEGEILRVVGSAVLLRGDVLHVMGKTGLLLAKEAVLATIPGPRADKLPRLGVHQDTSLVARYRLALSLRIEMKSSVLM